MHTIGSYFAFNALKLPLSNGMDLFGASVRGNLLNVAHRELVSVIMTGTAGATIFLIVLLLQQIFWSFVSSQ